MHDPARRLGIFSAAMNAQAPEYPLIHANRGHSKQFMKEGQRDTRSMNPSKGRQHARKTTLIPLNMDGGS
eukprot:2333331-Amphidinium_carterae.1